MIRCYDVGYFGLWDMLNYICNKLLRAGISFLRAILHVNGADRRSIIHRSTLASINLAITNTSTHVPNKIGDSCSEQSAPRVVPTELIQRTLHATSGTVNCLAIIRLLEKLYLPRPQHNLHPH